MHCERNKVHSSESFLSSLRARLILLVLIAMAPVLGLTLYTAFEQRQLSTAAVQETALRLARLTSTQQRQMILGTRQLLIGLAQLREVREDNANCSSFFALLLKAYPVYSNMGAINRHGEVYCSAIPMAGSTSAADRPYFKRAIQSADFAIGDYQIGRITGKAAINFGYPVIDDKRMIHGVVFAALSLDWLNQIVNEADLPRDSTFSVTDRNGTILVRYPDGENWVGKKSPENLLVPSARNFTAGVAEASEPDGIPRLIGFTPLLGRKDAGDVYVSIGVPKRVAFAEADGLLSRNLTWLAIIAVIAFGSAWVGGDLFILRQVNAVVDAAKQLEAGNLSSRIGAPYAAGELGKLAHSFDEMAVSLQKNAIQLEYQATHDALTGLPNRRFFTDHLESEILTAQLTGQRLALLMMDLDSFKEINDTIGHHNGDLFLKEVTQRLKTIMGNSGIVARLGGDEFAVLLFNANLASAVLAARKIIHGCEEPFVLDELPIAIEVSVGIALYPDHGESADFLSRRAEVAMYLAKEEKTGYALYAAEKDRYSSDRLVLLAELRRAIETNQLYLLYQPKMDLPSRTVNGVEALVRWQHPKLGMIPPDQFIGLAERTGLMKPLTFWVLNEAFRQCNAWHSIGIELRVAVNISSRNLEADFPDHIGSILGAANLPAHYVDLEITEGTLMKDPGQAKAILTRLSKMGVKISIDDFGTGYSSLSYLSKLPVNEVKIDQSFVRSMSTDQNAAVIVRSTINLGHQLGLSVVAEGVETEQVLDELTALDCDAAQGYYISRPVDAASLTEWFGKIASIGRTEVLNHSKIREATSRRLL